MVVFRFDRRLPWLFLVLPWLIPLILVVYGAVEEGYWTEPATAWGSLVIFGAGWLVLASVLVPQGRLVVDAEGITVIRGWHRLHIPWRAVTAVERILVQATYGDTTPPTISESEVGTTVFERDRVTLQWAYIIEIRFRDHASVRRRGYFRFMGRTLRLQPAAIVEGGVEEALAWRWPQLRAPITPSST